MRRVFLICAVATVVVARPELYKETEDFQFARSSSDDGTKSGFYGAQRGNMGGNFERAHNMDSLAQHQMSGLVRQVDGELGDAANKRTGSVYTAANSRGVFGSGRYDTSNLQGRNFHEGKSFEDTQAHSSLSQNSDYNQHSSHGSMANYGNSLSNNRRYNGFSGYNGYEQQRAGESQVAEDLNAGSFNYGRQAGQSTGHVFQSGYNDHSQHHEQTYDESDSHHLSATNSDSNAQTRVISGGMPIRIKIRPGTRASVPVAAHVYDASNTGSSFDHNAIHSEAESLARANEGISYNPSTSLGNSKAKHYESSYSYKKEWEKHDTQPGAAVPLAVPTISPYPKNSELYDDGQVARLSNDRFHAFDSASQRQYDSKSQLASSQSRYNANQQQLSSSALRSGVNTYGTFNTGAAGDLDSIGNVDTKPKSYQSSYSYHKSWERQGDPYVIKPATGSAYDDGQVSQRLTSADQAVYSSHQHGSHHRQSHQRSSAIEDCDEGQLRVERSADFFDQQESDFDQGQMVEDLGQQTQNAWDTTSNQRQLEKIEDFGQQTQGQLENLNDFGQQTQGQLENFKDFGQQTQGQLDNLNDFGQQSQNKWENLQTFAQHANNLNKESGQVEQQMNWQNQKENQGQQTQDMWGSFTPYDISQNTNNKHTAEEQIKPVWEQSADDIQQHSGNSDYFPTDSGNYKPWMQTQTNNFQQTQSPYNNNKWNFNSGMNDKHEHDFISTDKFNSNSNSRDTSSLQSLWNKIYDLEKVNTLNDHSNKFNVSSEHDNAFSQNFSSFQHSYQSWAEEKTSSNNFSSGSTFEHQYINKNHSDTQPWPSISTSQKPNTQQDNIRPIDIGRGDIESEDSTYEQPNKTFEEIEALSLSRDKQQHGNSNTFQSTHNKEDSLAVVSLSEQKRIENQQKHNIEVKLSSTTTPSNIKDEKTQVDFVQNQQQTLTSDNYFENKHDVIVGTATEKSQVELTSIQKEQKNEMETINQINQGSDSYDQQSQLVGENMEDFGQQSQNAWDKNLEDLGQQTQTAWNKHESDLNHHSQNDWEQNLKDIGQQSQTELGQNLKHVGQESETVWDKQSADLGQQSQTVWDKQSEDLGQQSQSEWGQNLKDFGQQSQTVWDKQSADFGQQSQTEWEQNLKDLGHQSQTAFDKDVEDLGQKTQSVWDKIPEEFSPELKPKESLEQQNSRNVKNYDSTNNQEVTHELIHEEIQQHKYQDISQTKNVEELPSVPEEIVEAEVTTPKPGTWISFKNKLSSAKDKVSSWFKRS